MSEGTPLFCPARQGPGPARIHSGVGTGAATRCQHEGDRTAAGTPGPARPHKPLPGTKASRPLQAPLPLCPVPRESPRPVAVLIPASASSTHGSSMALSRRCRVCCPARLTPSRCPQCPRGRDRLSWSRALPAPHSCTGSAGPARPRGRRGQPSVPSHPLGTVLQDPRGVCEESGHGTVM